MRTLRLAAALALALTFAPSSSAGVAGSTYLGDFNVDGTGDCATTTFAFDGEGNVEVSGCSAVYEGTYSQLDLFLVGFWSLKASTGGSQTTQLELSGIDLYFGARLYGGGKAFGANVRVWGVRQDEGEPPARALAFDRGALDVHRSPERL